jgi:hypothetical protein
MTKLVVDFYKLAKADKKDKDKYENNQRKKSKDHLLICGISLRL